MRDKIFYAAAAAMLAALVLVYSNHFHNAFHFDDFHTITGNPTIRQLANVPRFFADARTFSIYPGHQSYRPLLSLLLAVDYWFAGELKPVAFHIESFVWYVALVALLHFVYVAVLGGTESRWHSLVATGLYGLHPANADTVNYLIQRGELISTAGVLAGLSIWVRFENSRRTHLYLIPVALGILAKPTAAAFPGILFCYVLLFEENLKIGCAWRRVWPAVAVCAAVVGFALWMEAGLFRPGSDNAVHYWMTQPYVAWHYFRSFFAPYDLSADPDLAMISGCRDPRLAYGIVFVAGLAGAAWKAARYAVARPIAFGIAWFLIAQLPAAAAPLAEVSNDHRMFFPFAGLAIAVVALVRLALRDFRVAPAVIAIAVLAVCGYATHRRNEVWRTEESLWRDVIEKSPANGRGFMNYGVTQLGKGDFAGALASFERALPLTPDYSLLYINLGIANGKLGRDAMARQCFERAIVLAPADPQSYTYYARWLREEGRSDEARRVLERCPAQMSSW